MVTLLQKGHYRLIETKNQTKILTLDNKYVFAWVFAKEIGELLVTTHKTHKTDNVLAQGSYRLYDVVDEPKLTDLIHMELFTGEGEWQGYLLLTGLPTDKEIRSRIIPTIEIITKQTH